MIKKIISYYKCFGFKETIKKINRYILISIKTRDGTYKLDKREKQNIVLKRKRIFVIAKENYSSIDEWIKQWLKELNDMGFCINYICAEKTSKIKNSPLSFYKSINKIKSSEEFTNNDICLIKSYDSRLDDIYKKIDKCQIYIIGDIVGFKNSSKNIKGIIRNDNKYLKKENDISIITPKTATKLIMKDNISKKYYNNIAIIVLNYNNKGLINKCIDSLIKYQKRYKYEINIIDNKSTDGSYEMLKDKYKDINLYQNTKNGCSSGRNLGVSKTDKDYILFLDSDQWPFSDYWLDNYLDIIDEENIGAIGWAGGWFNNLGYAFHTFDNFENRYMPPQGLYRKDIGYLGTGGMMIKKALFDKIKGFDVKYDPTCYEDTDISLNIRNNNKEIVYCPYLLIEHKAHQTTKSGSEKHNELIKEKGNYFVSKWKKINPNLLKYRK